MFASLLTLLKRSDDQRSLQPLMWIPVVMVAWVNLHGGWVVGLGFFALWAITRVVTNGQHRVAIAGVLGAALAATLINPYGVAMWQCHDVAFAPDGVLFAGENDHPQRSSFLWEIQL